MVPKYVTDRTNSSRAVRSGGNGPRVEPQTRLTRPPAGRRIGPEVRRTARGSGRELTEKAVMAAPISSSARALDAGLKRAGTSRRRGLLTGTVRMQSTRSRSSAGRARQRPPREAAQPRDGGIVVQLPPRRGGGDGADLVGVAGAHLGIDLDISRRSPGQLRRLLLPERALVFDVNDFDEARQGPWEWDVCRLAASVVVAGREYLSSSKEELGDLAQHSVGAYVETIGHLAALPLIERCYAMTRVAPAPDRAGANPPVRIRKAWQPLFGNVQVQTQRETIKKLIDDRGRGAAFVHDAGTAVSEDVAARVTAAYGTYLSTLEHGVQRLLDGYSPTCVAMRPVGEGSLGLRDYLVKLTGQGSDDGLILQVKEATPSALDGASAHARPCTRGSVWSRCNECSRR